MHGASLARAFSAATRINQTIGRVRWCIVQQWLEPVQSHTASEMILSDIKADSKVSKHLIGKRNEKQSSADPE